MTEHDQVPVVVPDCLSALVPIAKAIVDMFGRHCEVVIHDLSDLSSLDSTIVFVQGCVTGRQVGGPPTDYLLRQVRSQKPLGDYVVYPGRTDDGRPLRSATVFIRDRAGTVVGTVCINLDLTDFLLSKAALETLCEEASQPSDLGVHGETFARDADQTFESILQAALRSIGKPIAYMDKQDRVRFVAVLDEMGAFLLRGGVERVARALNVSRPTVYKYLNEGRGGEQGDTEG